MVSTLRIADVLTVLRVESATKVRKYTFDQSINTCQNLNRANTVACLVLLPVKFYNYCSKMFRSCRLRLRSEI